MSLANLPEEEAARQLGAWLRDIRLAADLTQAELAALAGLSRKHLVAIEGGHVRPGFFPVLKLCHALGVDLDPLITAKPPLC